MSELLNTKPVTMSTTSLVRYDRVELENGPSWLGELRTAAIERFNELGFPTRRDEEWRFTSVTPIVETPFALGERVEVAKSEIAKHKISGAFQIVFVNGHYEPDLSNIEGLPDGVVVSTLAQAIAGGYSTVRHHLGKYVSFENHAFAALNTASIVDGIYINIPRNTVVERPFHIIYRSETDSDATVSHPRALIVAGENSQSTIVERFDGPADIAYFTNAVTEIVLADNAIVDHNKVQQESRTAFHIASIGVKLGTGSVFTSNSIGLGGSISRNDVSALMGGEGAECTLNGLFIGRGNQLIDNHTSIDHAVPHCPSHEMYKHILDDHSRGVFNGKIFVRLDAQKTDAKQSNQTILLSNDAQITTKPQLEIFADDVRCTHGATIGQLRPEAMFYLQSRGIGKEQARDLLIYAFASEVVQKIKIEELREQIDHVMLSERAIEGI